MGSCEHLFLMQTLVNSSVLKQFIQHSISQNCLLVFIIDYSNADNYHIFLSISFTNRNSKTWS